MQSTAKNKLNFQVSWETQTEIAAAWAPSLPHPLYYFTSPPTPPHPPPFFMKMMPSLRFWSRHSSNSGHPHSAGSLFLQGLNWTDFVVMSTHWENILFSTSHFSGSLAILGRIFCFVAVFLLRPALENLTYFLLSIECYNNITIPR